MHQLVAVGRFGYKVDFGEVDNGKVIAVYEKNGEKSDDRIAVALPQRYQKTLVENLVRAKPPGIVWICDVDHDQRLMVLWKEQTTLRDRLDGMNR